MALSKSRTLAGFVLLASTALCGMAEAQTRWITFGDSLSDNGNLFALAGQPPAPYFNGRFSNGPVWIELLAGPQARWTGAATPTGSLNFAFGGSRTDTLMTPGPGTATQVGAFFAGGGRIGANDIVTMWAGANNILQGIAVPANQSTTAMSALATRAATDVVTQVGQIAAAGARTIVVANLPDIGAAPSFNTSPASPLASLSVSTFNATLAAGLANVAAANPGTRILQINVSGLLSAVIANPSAFGFSNVTNQCLTTAACVTGNQATQNTNLFWDGVHPTAAGHVAISRTVAQYLDAPDRALAAGAISEIALGDRRAGAYRALERIADFKPRAGTTDVYISIIGDQANVGSRGSAPSYNVAAGGLAFGLVRHLSGETSLGLAFSAKTGEANTSANGNKITMAPTSFTADIVGRWAAGTGAFIQGALGASVTRISEFERAINIGSLINRGETMGYGFSAIVQGGYNLNMGSVTLTPSVRVGYLSGSMQAFTESGIVAPIAYSSRVVSTFLAAAELKASVALSPAATAHAMIGYEAYFGQSGTSLKGSIADSPGSGFSRNAGKVESPGFLFGVGLSGMIGSVQASAEYRGAVSGEGRSQHRGTLSARIAF
ncbi:fatty_acyltransferase_like domain containing protein [Rhabdaerophilaceae bacterium]